MSFVYRITSLVTLIICLGFSFIAKGSEIDHEITKLQQDWAIAKFQTPKNQQVVELEKLITHAQALNQAHPNQPELMLWYGTILSTYASLKGGITVLPQVKKAKELLETSIALNDNLDHGFAYGVLGTLYARVPGWPLSYGDKKKAREFLEIAIQKDPNSIDANYYFGDFLVDLGAHQEARKHLEMAMNAPIRPEYQVQDKGRKAEVAIALSKLQRLGH